MQESYYLRYKNKIIGYLKKSKKRLVYIPNKEVADTIPNGLGYPLGLFPLDRKKKGMEPLKDYIPGEEEIKLWLSDRVFPSNREGAYKLLGAMGLNSYDTWEIAKRTKAVSFNDHYWMSTDPHERYEMIHPRYANTSSSNKIKRLRVETVSLRSDIRFSKGRRRLLKNRIKLIELQKKQINPSFGYQDEMDDFFPNNEPMKIF